MIIEIDIKKYNDNLYNYQRSGEFKLYENGVSKYTCNVIKTFNNNFCLTFQNNQGKTKCFSTGANNFNLDDDSKITYFYSLSGNLGFKINDDFFTDF